MVPLPHFHRVIIHKDQAFAFGKEVGGGVYGMVTAFLLARDDAGMGHVAQHLFVSRYFVRVDVQVQALFEVDVGLLGKHS